MDVCFETEDPVAFARRRRRAAAARARAAAALRRELVIDSMPHEGVAVLSPADARRVLEKATSSSAELRRRVETNEDARRFAETLAGETRREFARAMNAVAFATSETDANVVVSPGTYLATLHLRSSPGYDFAASRERSRSSRL